VDNSFMVFFAAEHVIYGGLIISMN